MNQALGFKILELKEHIKGDVFTDVISTTIYATDASVYKEKPLGVVRPKDADDIQKIIIFANEKKIPLIPRTAGTSLAGQVVGQGLVVDVSKYMTQILEVNKEEHWVRVQPGVVTDELNKYLEAYGLFFGPETSTSNRCMIGGMVGNNSCGAHSLIYGNTRDHTLEIKGFLSDGSEVIFNAISSSEFEKKCEGENLENKIYRQIKNTLSETSNQKEIEEQYPDKKLKRRNTGYALDLLLDTQFFSKTKEPFNFCKLIAGSEGTLVFMTEIKLNLVPLPPKVTGLMCAHFNTLREAFLGNLVALDHKPGAVEMMDDVIIECAKSSVEHSKNSFFVKGNPKAILVIEFVRDTKEEILEIAQSLEEDFRAAGLGYHFPLIFGTDTKKVWNLRKAGLGLLSNVVGDKKPVTVIEDTAVNPEVLPDYLEEFEGILKKYGLRCVYYAHIATGEIHLKPELNLKDPKDVEIFRALGKDVALLVKKYRGSLSGEHGDGRLRGEFIPLMLGEKVYQLLKEVKNTWDPLGIFNPGKITDTPPMNTSLRYKSGQKTKELKTYFDFSSTQGMMRAIEACNGSADCRKSELIGGTMCPSYMATKNENSTTRARANILREFISTSLKSNPFDHKEIYEVLDLCLSCKGCKSECPSNVDMTKLKAEFLQHYYESNGVPLRSKMVATFGKIHKLFSKTPFLYNLFARAGWSASLIKNILNFAPQRKLPFLSKQTLLSWWLKHCENPENPIKKIYLFADEFTNYSESDIGIKTIQLLRKLGYAVIIPQHIESGRTYLSKGLVKKAKAIANRNVVLLKHLITEKTPLIGIEPSAILTFRDEYIELADKDLVADAKKIAAHTFLIDEFIAAEIEMGNIKASSFSDKEKHIKLHGHCHQKSLASTASIVKMLTLPVNYKVEEIKSGCCGMAGSFGYEKEHYELSMQIGELVLFPEVRKAKSEQIISAPGTSCRQQIQDGTGRKAFHPVEILFDALT
ncbi:MAG: FAD-binding protein [Bacteroidetes bacterium RIFOXYA12_FULL_35_11]|nr:MAG: FAD-binding protein [Bacteroidetes bacterium GWF2_35_48]OFY74689.1 MAG: FAD-binding protein [Bacteroidetes bacterium RIFOXYA12_FULL_35_11]OFY97889.1 MAG: FAD-binding protein [Bacteroidetes bacterium RIFOXYC12_FULL_35_7]HBX49917.1 FAD-binding oxidoreductase [Bacteroidales bacterium]